jgi:hypothetical protein
VNHELATVGAQVGPLEIMNRAHVTRIRGTADAADRQRLLRGYWQMQAADGLFAVRPNSIRVSDDGDFYYTVTLPTEAPEGKYSVTTYFLSDHGVEVDTAALVVRTSGIISVISRYARKSPVLYGMLTVLVAVGAGWLGGAVLGHPGGRR